MKTFILTSALLLTVLIVHMADAYAVDKADALRCDIIGDKIECRYD